MGVLPPILSYAEDTDISPWRVQPLFGEGAPNRSLDDLGDLDRAERHRQAWMIQPRLPEIEQESLLAPGSSRVQPLLPRRYRDFLRKPGIRAGVAAAVTAVTILGVVWMTQLRQTEAVAAGKFHIERHALRSALDGALTYGVAPRLLVPLLKAEQTLRTHAPPGGSPLPWGPSATRTVWYRRQTATYSALVYSVHRLEQRAMGYWIWREGVTYVAVLGKVREADALGLHESSGPIPACGTPACFQGAIARQQGYIAWLRETIQTLHVYARAVLVAPDPGAAAALEMRKASALAAIGIPQPEGTRILAPLADWPWGGPAGSRSPHFASTSAAARAGALAHLDVDVLEHDLFRWSRVGAEDVWY
jgi:hypothetical protein